MTNSNYKIYYPNTLTVPEDSYLEVDFDDTFAFSPWLENSDVTLTDVGGGISASVATFDRENKIIRSTINTGSVWVNDLIELSVNNLKIHNPSATGSYVLPIVIYDSVGAEIEAGTGMITLDYPYQQVQLNVNIEESLQLGVDSGSVLIEVDPDDQLGQNWSGTGGEVSEKTAVEVKTNAQSGYNLMISLSGKTATGSAVLDGRTLTGSQITSTAGDRVDLENNFTFVLNSSGSTSVTDFKNTTTQIIWAGTSGATNGYIDNIFYYLNVDHTIPADSYEGTIVYTAIRQL